MPASRAPMSVNLERKARGAFFTPSILCDYVVNWAIRSPQDAVLEPSCGEAAFLESAARKLHRLGEAEPRLFGFELHPESALVAANRVNEAGAMPVIRIGDFFSEIPVPEFDAVIGNPPYVRYQDFSGDSRAKARAAALRAGVPISNLASSWAAFTVHAALFLRRGGRLGLVLPAELLSVNYASAVRRFLLEQFQSVSLIMFTERVFPGVQEEIVLLLADGYQDGPAGHFKVFQATNEYELPTAITTRWYPKDPGEKWTASLLNPEAATILSQIKNSGQFGVLEDWGATSLGIVTGRNKFFCLNQEQVSALGIPKRDLVPLSPPGSNHLRGLEFSQRSWTELGNRSKAIWLFRPPGDPSSPSLKYIEEGERSGVDRAYKCHVRRPWWRVPMIKVPDLFLTYMNADVPRMSSNSARVVNLNSVHGFYPDEDLSELSSQVLPIASLNSITLLVAETHGRSYGGGVLKIEPKEADGLPMPRVEILSSAKDALDAIRPIIALNLRSGNLDKAIQQVDSTLLVQHMGISRSDVRSIRHAHEILRNRRTSRGKGKS